MECEDRGDLALYALRPTLNLFELACLAHGADPEAVSNASHDALTAHWKQALGMPHGPKPAEFVGLAASMPERVLGDQIGGTLKRLFIATGEQLNTAIPAAEARRLLAALGFDPPALSDPIAQRQERRYARFLQLGGGLRKAGNTWHVTGRGALAALSREERAAGHPMWDKNDLKGDLIAAHEAQLASGS